MLKGTSTYVAVKYSKETLESLSKFLIENKIQSCVAMKDIHTTVMMSKNLLVDFKSKGKVDFFVEPTHFVSWKTREGNNSLILVVKSDLLLKRHQEIIDEHQAEHEHAIYEPHITLSYNNNFDVYRMKSKIKDLDALHVIFEYHEDFNSVWKNELDI